jgi:hypothetical protein
MVLSIVGYTNRYQRIPVSNSETKTDRQKIPADNNSRFSAEEQLLRQAAGTLGDTREQCVRYEKIQKK